MDISLFRLCFVLGVSCAIDYEYGGENAKAIAALGNRISLDPYYQFTESDLSLIDEAVDCFNQMGYILDLPHNV